MDENSEQAPDQRPPSSGNRWEPANPEAEPDWDLYANPNTGTETTAAAPPSRPAWLTRARAGVAGGAAAALLVGGLGGFAVGRAAGPDEGPGDRQGVPTGFDRDGDGHGYPGPDGQVPVMPGSDDGQQDDGTDGSTT